MVRSTLITLLAILHAAGLLYSQGATTLSDFGIIRLKYGGGGDWYNDPQEEVNLLKFIGENSLVKTDPKYEFISIDDDRFFSHPFIFMTGHGNIVFTDQEAERLRRYLENGGFLYADDDYGMDKAFRREMKKVFPEQELIELPFSHGLYNCQFEFPFGPPKIHAHDDKPAQGFGLFFNGRLVVYYTYESNPSDGWNDPELHNDTPEKHLGALRFGTNVVVWALTH